MMNMRKAFALLFVGMMTMSVLVAISAPAVADTEMENNVFVVYDTTFMMGEMTWFANAAGTNPYNLGEGDGIDDDATTGDSCQMRITVRNDDTDQASDFYVNISNYDNTVLDFPDTVAGTTGTQVSVGPFDIPAGNTQNYDFTFDVIATDIPLGTSVDTQFRVEYDFIDDGGPTDVTGYDPGSVYICSIFDNATAIDETVPDIQDEEANDDSPFEAGDSFEAAEMDLYNADSDAIDDLTAVVTLPGTPPGSDGITFSGDRDTCWIPTGIPATDVVATLFRVEVDPRTAPGEYDATVDITYTRAESGLTVTENDLATGFDVDYSFGDDDPEGNTNPYSEFQCRATDVTIVDTGDTARQIDVVAPYDTYTQSSFGDKRIKINVTIENNGNSPIYNVEFELQPDAWGPGDFFRNPLFFYHETGVLDADRIVLTVSQLDVGATVNFTIEVTVLKEIPIGPHRLPILYRGFYFRDGSLGMATGFVQTNGGTDLEIIFEIRVVDPVIDAHVTVTTVNPNDKTDIRAQTIVCTLTNDEGYNFIDIRVRANFTGCPWYQPVILQGGPYVWADEANPATPTALWAAGGDITATFTVDTDYYLVPDRYPFSLDITAIIEETLVEVTATIGQLQGAVIDFTGYGPIVWIEAFTADAIVPGERFDLDLTIVNDGDDTLRDIWIVIPPDNTEEYPWDLEREFKEQFDWGFIFEDWFELEDVGESFTLDFAEWEFPSEMFYTMETLDVDNVREIIEINLYMDGVYSMPGSTINMIHVMELAPGGNISVNFEMIADKDMVNGKPYNVVVTINGIGADGEAYQQIQTLEVLSSLPGDSYNPVELDWFDAGLKLLALVLFFIIVLAILLWVYNKYKGEPEEEEEDEEEFDFEDEEPPSFEAETKVETKEPELIAP
jgi:hypothetical protein